MNPSTENQNQTPTQEKEQKYQSLAHQTYINDIVVNDTLKKIVRNIQNVSYLNSYFMYYGVNPSHWNTPTMQAGIRKIRDQTEIRFWYLPHCTNSHWYYLRIDTIEGTITQSDPLNTRGQHYGTNITALLMEVHNSWRLEYKEIQYQHNGYDCGPYILNSILHETRNTEDQVGRPSRNTIHRFLTEDIQVDSFNTLNPDNPRPKTNQEHTQTEKKTLVTHKHTHKRMMKSPQDGENGTLSTARTTMRHSPDTTQKLSQVQTTPRRRRWMLAGKHKRHNMMRH